MIKSEWHNCYGKSWKGTIVDPAFCHPAKVSKALARRIYDHISEEGWIKRGDRVLDPFGGIGGFALHAMHNGLHFVGVELEVRFVALGNANINLWNERYAPLFPS